MAVVITLWILFYSLVFVYSFDDLKDCVEAKNYTFPERKDQLTGHNYRFIEECLYVHLSKKADEDSGRPNTIGEEIPVGLPGKSLTISVEEATLTDIADPGDSLSDVSVAGYIKFRLNSVKVLSIYPENPSARDTGGFIVAGIGLWEDTKSTYQGKITATWDFDSEDAKCHINFSNFPGDEHYCCFQVSPTVNVDVIKFAIKKQNGVIDDDVYSKVWKIEKLETKLIVDKQKGDESHTLKICLLAARSAKTLKMAFILPLSIVAVLIVILPLYGPLETQNYVKMFTLLIYISLYKVSSSTVQNQVSGILCQRFVIKFYEFSIIITILSLLLSVVLAAIGRLERKTPPSDKLYLFAAAINSKLCCGELQPTLSWASQHQQSGEGHQPFPETGVNYAEDWVEIFRAVNSLFSVGILAAYIVVSIVLILV